MGRHTQDDNIAGLAEGCGLTGLAGSGSTASSGQREIADIHLDTGVVLLWTRSGLDDGSLF